MKLPTGTTAAAAAAAAASSSCSVYQSHIASLATHLHPRVLVPMQGSGNYGESGACAFYTLDKLPLALMNMMNNSTDTTSHTRNMARHTSNPLERVDLDLGPDRLAFYVDHVLSSAEADALAACAHAILQENGHSRLAPGIQTPPGMRVNEAAHWFPAQTIAQPWLTALFDRFRHLVPSTLDGLPLHDCLSEKVAQFVYNKGDFFQRHVDGLFPGQGANASGDGVEEWQGVVSGMSMLFYLNDEPHDGLQGGETRLWSANGTHHVDVTPRKGRVLFFRRGSPDAVLHAGLPVTGDVPKYMALINLAYGKQTGTRPLIG